MIKTILGHAASTHEHGYVTVNVSQLGLKRLPQGAELILDLKPPRSKLWYKTVWHVNREHGKTMSTRLAQIFEPPTEPGVKIELKCRSIGQLIEANGESRRVNGRDVTAYIVKM